MPIHPDFPFPLYLVISEQNCKHHHWLKVAEEAILGGVDIIQIREKNIRTKDYLHKARELKKITDKYQVPLIINDEVAIAIELETWGIHVGRTDMQPAEILAQNNNKFKIGWSLELMEQLQDPQIDAVHHLGLSPIFKTATKPNTITTWGFEGIAKISTLTQKPLIAIGGMNISNCQEAFRSGANSIAVVSAICADQDPRKAAEKLKELLQ